MACYTSRKTFKDLLQATRKMLFLFSPPLPFLFLQIRSTFKDWKRPVKENHFYGSLNGFPDTAQDFKGMLMSAGIMPSLLLVFVFPLFSPYRPQIWPSFKDVEIWLRRTTPLFSSSFQAWRTRESWRCWKVSLTLLLVIHQLLASFHSWVPLFFFSFFLGGFLQN